MKHYYKTLEETAKDAYLYGKIAQTDYKPHRVHNFTKGLYYSVLHLFNYEPKRYYIEFTREELTILHLNKLIGVCHAKK